MYILVVEDVSERRLAPHGGDLVSHAVGRGLVREPRSEVRFLVWWARMKVSCSEWENGRWRQRGGGKEVGGGAVGVAAEAKDGKSSSKGGQCRALDEVMLVGSGAGDAEEREGRWKEGRKGEERQKAPGAAKSVSERRLTREGVSGSEREDGGQQRGRVPHKRRVRTRVARPWCAGVCKRGCDVHRQGEKRERQRRQLSLSQRATAAEGPQGPPGRASCRLVSSRALVCSKGNLPPPPVPLEQHAQAQGPN